MHAVGAVTLRRQQRVSFSSRIACSFLALVLRRARAEVRVPLEHLLGLSEHSEGSRDGLSLESDLLGLLAEKKIRGVRRMMHFSGCEEDGGGGEPAFCD